MGRIRAGEYTLGSRIPSEPELARTFGIGRPTVRQATDQLIQKRRLERRRGSGTFVTEPPAEVDLFQRGSIPRSVLLGTRSSINALNRSFHLEMV